MRVFVFSILIFLTGCNSSSVKLNEKNHEILVKITQEDYSLVDCVNKVCKDFNEIVKNSNKKDLKNKLKKLAVTLRPESEIKTESVGLLWIMLVVLSYYYFKLRSESKNRKDQFIKIIKTKNRKIDELEEKINFLKEKT